MDRLESVSMEELHELLSEVDEGTPAQPALAAIAYRKGDSKTGSTTGLSKIWTD